MSMIIFLTRLGKTTSSSSTTQQPSISGDSMLNIQQIVHADMCSQNKSQFLNFRLFKSMNKDCIRKGKSVKQAF